MKAERVFQILGQFSYRDYHRSISIQLDEALNKRGTRVSIFICKVVTRRCFLLETPDLAVQKLNCWAKRGLFPSSQQHGEFESRG